MDTCLIRRVQLVIGFSVALLSTQDARAQVLALKPVGSTGSHVIAGNSIQILPGGATVDFEILVSDWSSAPGSPLLGSVCATLNHLSFLGANALPSNPGVDLLPLGYALPDPNGGNRPSGHFIVQNVCQTSGRNCSPGFGLPPCMSGEGSCIDNPRWFPVNNSPIAFLSLQTLTEYQSGAVCQNGGASDPQNEDLGYVSTLRMVVPANASGTYSLSFKNNENFTFLTDSDGFEIPLPELRSARIIITNALSPNPALEISKNRYVSFTPTAVGTAAYRIELVASTMNPGAVGFTGWLGTPTSTLQLGAVSQVVPAPVFRTWDDFAVHVGDCEIMPGSIYELRSTLDGTNFSPPITLETAPQPSGKDWGDVVGLFGGQDRAPPDGLANVNDILALVSAASGYPNSPAKARANLHAVSASNSCLNDFVNGADVFMAILAVSGRPYPFERNPASCGACP